jgi:HK97 family phage portal protein
LNPIRTISRSAAAWLLRASGAEIAWKMRRGSIGWLGRLDSEGRRIDVRTILAIATARRCIDAVSGDLAALPLSLVQERPADVDREAVEHPAYRLFKRSPDGGDSTPMRFRQAIAGHALGVGNGYAQVAWSANRRAVNLYLLDPLHTSIVEDDGRLAYQAPGAARPLPRDEVIHLAGLGWDGVRGFSPVDLHPRAFGLTADAELHGGSFLTEGASAGGFLKQSQQLTDEAMQQLIDEFERRHRGAGKAGRWGLLPVGVDVTKMTVDPEAAQLLETRQFQVLEMCRIFGVPPHRVMDYSAMHYSTVEATNREYVQTVLLIWAKAFEEVLNLRLLTDEEQAAGFTFRHDFSALLRGDVAARTAQFDAMSKAGAISPNQWAIEEGFPPFKGGDVHRFPLNTGPAGGGTASPEPTPDQPEATPEEPQP